jgi:hypothetical protein
MLWAVKEDGLVVFGARRLFSMHARHTPSITWIEFSQSLSENGAN